MRVGEAQAADAPSTPSASQTGARRRFRRRPLPPRRFRRRPPPPTAPSDSRRHAEPRPLPSGFLGLSMQYKAFEQYAGANPKALNPAFLNLVRDIAPNQSPVLRFGGDSTDWTWWPVPGMKQPAGVTYTLTPKWLQIARAMNTALNSRLILGVNLEAASVKLATDRGQRAGQRDRQAEHRRPGDRQRARAVLGVQLVPPQRRRRQGPDVASWTEAAFFKQFNQFAGVMPAGIPVAGPASGSATYLAELGLVPEGPAPRQALHVSRLPAQALHRRQGPDDVAAALAGGDLRVRPGPGPVRQRSRKIRQAGAAGRDQRDHLRRLRRRLQRVRIGPVGARHAVRARQGRRRRGQHPDRPRLACRRSSDRSPATAARWSSTPSSTG